MDRYVAAQVDVVITGFIDNLLRSTLVYTNGEEYEGPFTNLAVNIRNQFAQELKAAFE